VSTPPPPPSTPPPTPAPPPLPDVPSSERVRLAYTTRHESDYVFANPGLDIFLIVITCGLWGLYIFYQLMRRMRDHTKRRLELLDGATAFAWEQATRQGKTEELRPTFERIQAHLSVLRSMTADFRDPVIWLVIALISSGIGYWIGYILIDGDLIKHDRATGAIEAELREVYASLGAALPTPDPARVKDAHNYVGRIVATLLTCGLYQFWWTYNMMVEGNEVFEADWPWEDALADAVQRLDTAA